MYPHAARRFAFFSNSPRRHPLHCLNLLTGLTPHLTQRPRRASLWYLAFTQSAVYLLQAPQRTTPFFARRLPQRTQMPFALRSR